MIGNEIKPLTNNKPSIQLAKNPAGSMAGLSSYHWKHGIVIATLFICFLTKTASNLLNSAGLSDRISTNDCSYKAVLTYYSSKFYPHFPKYDPACRLGNAKKPREHVLPLWGSVMHEACSLFLC